MASELKVDTLLNAQGGTHDMGQYNVGKTLQVVHYDFDTPVVWSGDNEVNVTGDCSITVKEGSRIRIDFDIPIYISGMSSSNWVSMGYVKLYQGGTVQKWLEHDGYKNVDTSERSWNNCSYWISPVQTAGTYTFHVSYDPYGSVNNYVFRGTEFSGSVTLTEIGA